MKKTILITVFIFLSTCVFSQYNANENKIWAFGNRAGLDFTSGTPVPFMSHSYANEGCASVCDAAGHMLFYTDGKIVYDRAGGLMPSGFPLVSWSTYSTTQAAVIIPSLSTTTQYYIFSLESEGVVGASRLAYSVVDMNLRGGLGDVAAATVGIPMDSNLSEKMIAIPGSRCNIWLLVHKADARLFYAYNITPAGISAPIISSFPTPLPYHCGIGAMVCSPDTRTIVAQNNLTASCGTDLYSFDTATGIVSNRIVLDSVHMYYGAEFSPDNSKLYSVSYNNAGNSVIEQYDLSLPSASAIKASRDTVVYGSPGLTTQMRLGPDGKIYLNNFYGDSSNFLDVIDSPNLQGTACSYVWHEIMLSAGTYGFLGMPSLFVAKQLHMGDYRSIDTTLCRNDRIYPIGTAGGYLWYDGSTGLSDSVSVSGTYWVIEENGCDANADSITVTVKQSPQPVYGHDSVCVGNSIALSEVTTGGVWSSGSPGVASVDASGLVTGMVQGNAVISYLVSSGCDATKNITVLPPCIDEVNEAVATIEDITLYPNPASNVCTFSVKGAPAQDWKVYIYDVAGKLFHIYPLSGPQTTVSIADLAGGIYQCRIENSDHMVTYRKLVVVR